MTWRLVGKGSQDPRKEGEPRFRDCAAILEDGRDGVLEGTETFRFLDGVAGSE